MGLYQRILGDDFKRLGDSLKAFHERGGSAKGSLDVVHAPHLIPRFFVWLMRLPRAGNALETTVEVSNVEAGELWDRQIGSTRLVTTQFDKAGRLIEQAGPLQFEFDLKEQGGAMVFHSYRSKILGIPLPNSIAPFVDARTEGDEGGWALRVDIQCPRFGVICRYEGKIEMV